MEIVRKHRIAIVISIIVLLGYFGLRTVLYHIPDAVRIPPNAKLERVMTAWWRFNASTGLPVSDFEYEVKIAEDEDAVQYVETFIRERVRDGWTIDESRIDDIQEYYLSRTACIEDTQDCEEKLYVKYIFMNIGKYSVNDKIVTLVVSWWGKE